MMLIDLGCCKRDFAFFGRAISLEDLKEVKARLSQLKSGNLGEVA